MDITKKTLFISLLISFVCLIASFVCACVVKFNIVSLILLGLVVLSTVATCVISWRVVVLQNRK